MPNTPSNSAPTQPLTATQSKALLRGLLEAQHDLLSLADRLRLSPERLADWVRLDEHHRRLVALCTLADLQTQLLLSRFRLLAAGRLIRLANGEGVEDEKQPGELARKACVDLLKLDLPRADERTPLTPAGDPLSQEAQLSALRNWLYADAQANPTPDAEPQP